MRGLLVRGEMPGRRVGREWRVPRAALVDWAAGHKVAAVNIDINYHKPLPLHQQLKVEARVTQIDKRKNFSAGEIKLSDGTIVVSGRGIYVVASKLFEKVEL